MVITQNAPRAIQDWASFNISANGTVQFDQQNSSWVALNRIFDQSPTQIFGKITAPGQIYLINQNGILFGRGSQVDVHTLIASSLNILDSDFMNGALNFTAQDYQGTGNTNYLNASVINQGKITTDTLGSVFLLASQCQKYDGTIQTYTGQIGLAAGNAVDIIQHVSVARPWNYVNVVTQASGSAVNDGGAVNNGTMTANTGLVGMYGANVSQNG